MSFIEIRLWLVLLFIAMAAVSASAQRATEDDPGKAGSYRIIGNPEGRGGYSVQQYCHPSSDKLSGKWYQVAHLKTYGAALRKLNSLVKKDKMGEMRGEALRSVDVEVYRYEPPVKDR